MIQMILNPFKFHLIQIGPSRTQKIETKYGFEDLEKMNNSLHRNFSRFGMDFSLKFRETSMFRI
jgi:hypothetical protein